MKKIMAFFVISLIFCNCNNDPKINFTENDIHPFFLHKQIDTTIYHNDTLIFIQKEYMVNNFFEYNDSIIANFLQKELKNEKRFYHQIILSFYKCSKTTNFSYLEKNPKYFDLYAAKNDAIYSASRDTRLKVDQDSFTFFLIKKNGDYGRIKRYSFK